MSVDDVLESMSAAYQVVLQVALLWHLEEDLIEDELVRREEANPACITCIAKQREHIAAASNGGIRTSGDPPVQ